MKRATFFYVFHFFFNNFNGIFGNKNEKLSNLTRNSRKPRYHFLKFISVSIAKNIIIQNAKM
jgi:hypothetical protein